MTLFKGEEIFYKKVQISTRGWQFKFYWILFWAQIKWFCAVSFFVQRSYGIEFSYFWYRNGSFKTLIIKIVIVSKNRYFWQKKRNQILKKVSILDTKYLDRYQSTNLGDLRPEISYMGFQILNFGFQILDVWFWISNFRFQDSNFRFFISDWRYGTSDFEFRILDFRI